MAVEITPERVLTIAAAARVPIDAEAVPRIVRGVTVPVRKIAEVPPEFPFETEPATFMLVQRQDLAR